MTWPKNNSEARRLIQQGAVRINGERVKDPNLRLDLSKGMTLLIQVGKKSFRKVRVV